MKEHRATGTTTSRAGEYSPGVASNGPASYRVTLSPTITAEELNDFELSMSLVVNSGRRMIDRRERSAADRFYGALADSLFPQTHRRLP